MLTSDSGGWTADSGRGCSPQWNGDGGVTPATWSGCLNEMKRRNPGRPRPQCSDPHPVRTHGRVNVGASCCHGNSSHLTDASQNIKNCLQ